MATGFSPQFAPSGISEWDPSLPAVLLGGLDPSTADAEVEDNTSRLCLTHAQPHAQRLVNELQ
ncbi:MAG: DUF1643 domain-containing protein [Synechococcaceae cyanobacterium SM2_3_2]|nr:DUF1643 domain-containing protein [Synechococcaceae cyanobacterium SM2_3_2]